MVIKSVTPSDLMNHRVFFTEFDRYGNPDSWASAEDFEQIERVLQRKIKLLVLTKGHVVVAASQLLESPFAHKMLRDEPELLKSGTIVSSMKYGHDSTVAFLSTKQEEAEPNQGSPYHTSIAKEVASLIDESGTIVRWAVHQMSDWFRDRLEIDLLDEQSLLRLTLKNQNVIVPPSLAGQIKNEKVLRRERVQAICKEYRNPELTSVVVAYADFLYYLSGARTTGSEGVLPQENLVDFSIGDLVGQKTKLSEHEIFFKIFIDTVKAKTSTIFPIDFLDSISIRDALELREIAISKEFTDKYNTIQLKTKEALKIHDPEKLVLLLNELEAFEQGLQSEFISELDRELPTLVAEKRKREAGKMAHSIGSLVIPFYEPDSVKDILVSGLRLAGRDKIADMVEKKVTKGLQACESFLEKMNVLEKQVLLDFVEKMKKKYREKM